MNSGEARRAALADAILEQLTRLSECFDEFFPGQSAAWREELKHGLLQCSEEEVRLILGRGGIHLGRDTVDKLYLALLRVLASEWRKAHP